jgi:hypothetical protein
MAAEAAGYLGFLWKYQAAGLDEAHHAGKGDDGREYGSARLSMSIMPGVSFRRYWLRQHPDRTGHGKVNSPLCL